MLAVGGSAITRLESWATARWCAASVVERNKITMAAIADTAKDCAETVRYSTGDAWLVTGKPRPRVSAI
jgi:hypothetical protein